MLALRLGRSVQRSRWAGSRTACRPRAVWLYNEVPACRVSRGVARKRRDASRSGADESHPGIDELVPVKHRRKVGDATLPAVHISLPPVEWLFFLFSVQDRNLAIPDRLRRCLAFTVIARLDHLQMILLWWYSLVHATWKPVCETRYHCRS